MNRQNQTAARQQKDRKSQPRSKPIPPLPVATSAILPHATVQNSSFEAQVLMLKRLHPPQRWQMLSRIRSLQGNNYVQRVVAAVNTQAHACAECAQEEEQQGAVSESEPTPEPKNEAAHLEEQEASAAARLTTATKGKSGGEEEDVKGKSGGEEEEDVKGKGSVGTAGLAVYPLAIQPKIGDGHDLTSPRFAGNAALEATFDNKRTVQAGHTGAHVRLIQEALMALGYELPKFGADGKMGKETAAAVRAFQQDTGAAVDGIVGPETMGFLDARDQGKELAPAKLPVVANTPVDPHNIIVQPGAPPIHVPAMGPNLYGFTDTETVSINITAIKNGGNWQAIVTGLTGNYSIRARLLAGQREVDPDSNTNAATFCPQITELDKLGNPAATAQWYMRSAVLAHERVHATRLRPALLAAAPAIEAAIEAVTIPEALAPTADVAAALLRAHPAFLLAVGNARNLWDAQYVALITGDHSAGGPAETAERAIVDPMIQRICNMRKANGWPACPPKC